MTVPVSTAAGHERVTALVPRGLVAVVATQRLPDVRARIWITSLDDLSHRLVVQAIDILADRGPILGRPLVDHVEHSTDRGR